MHIWFGLLTRPYPQNIKYHYITLEQMFIILLEVRSVVGTTGGTTSAQVDGKSRGAC